MALAHPSCDVCTKPVDPAANSRVEVRIAYLASGDVEVPLPADLADLNVDLHYACAATPAGQECVAQAFAAFVQRAEQVREEHEEVQRAAAAEAERVRVEQEGRARAAADDEEPSA